VTRCTGRRGGGCREALGRRGDGDGGGLTGNEAAPTEEGGRGGRRWSRRSPWLGERLGRSICGSNGTDGEPGRPEVEFGAGEVDHGRQWRTKGSRCSWATGRRGQREAQGHAAVWHAEAEGEKGKGGGSGSVHGEGEKKGGVRWLGTVWRRSTWGGAGGRQGVRPIGAVAGQRLPCEAGERAARVSYA
jgi:hypothetical protein